MDLSKLTALSESVRERTVKAKAGPTEKWYRIENATSATKIYVYDLIGEWGVTARDFVNELHDIKTPKIDLHLNSQGGQVFDGIAIYAALRNHPAQVTTHVDALAASAASFIAMAGDHVVMEPNARLMIHDAQGLCMGPGDDMRAMADLLDDLSDNIASIYVEKAGGDIKTWRKAMKAESWYSAEEAVDVGLADEVAGKKAEDEKRPAAQIDEQIVAWNPAAFISAVKECVA